VGYPLEGSPLSDVTPVRAVSTHQIGRLTCVSDFFGQRQAGGGGQLLQHNLPVQGGASGSPILDEEGEVVGIINAGSLVLVEGVEEFVTPEGPFAAKKAKRVASGIGANFAQRADLVGEILSGESSDAQARRDVEWRAAIDRISSAAIVSRNR